MRTLILVVLLTSAGCATTVQSERGFHPRRPVSTYSIVARDPDTGQLGVAVQSHWFSVGAIVPWAEAGVGAVATQSLVDPSYGPLGLAHMRAGQVAPTALSSLLAGDEGAAVRQVAMVDAAGNVAAHTGERCIAAAGHVVDEEHQFSVQANLMELESVWPAMAKAYRESDGDLAERMLAAMEAAQNEGGDIRGKQSAALLIVNAEPTGRSWEDRVFDLRIEDHPSPISELRRLVTLQRAYHEMNAGDLAMEHGDFRKASEHYGAAQSLAPHVVEIPFWHAVTLCSAGEVDRALSIFNEVFAREPIWAELVPRLVPSGLFPDDDELVRRVQALGDRSPPE